MNKRLLLFLSLIGAVLAILAFASPVLASVPQPTSLEIQDIEVFENIKETGDQLYIVTYYIVIESDYNAQQLFIFRLFNEDDDEIGFVRPYPYNNEGFGMGVVAFYVEPAEAPTWQSGVYVTVSGDPLIDWEGEVPSVSSDVIIWNTGTQSEMQSAVSAKILALASMLTNYWDEAMTTVVQGVMTLSDYGANYFYNVIPYFSLVAPYSLEQYTLNPDYPVDEKPASNSYAEELVTGIEDTLFDLSGPARSLGIDRGALTAAIYYSFVIGFIVMLIIRRGLRKGAMLVAWPFVVAGAFFGIPLMITILAGFFCLLSTVWLFYKGAV